MKFKPGDTVKISKNNSLLFKAAGLPAKIEAVNPYYSELLKKNLYNYDISVEHNGRTLMLCVDEQELTR